MSKLLQAGASYGKKNSFVREGAVNRGDRGAAGGRRVFPARRKRHQAKQRDQ